VTFSARILIGFSVVATLSVSSALAQVAGNPAEISSEQKKADGKAVKPTGAEIGALSEPKAEAVQSQPALIAGPGGGVGAVLDDSTMMYMIVTKRPDGKLDMDCVTGDKAAANRLANPKPVAVKPDVVAPKKEQLDVK
jgi:hypothetical protein